MAPATKERPALGPISVDESYPLPVFQQLTGLSVWALRIARRKGLRVRKVGNRKFVSGADWAAFLETREVET